MITRAVAAAAITLLATSAAATSADAGALPPKTSFTVVTSFLDPVSEIIEADGPWSDCSGVSDLSNSVNQVAPRRLRFSGEKVVLCEGGDVVIHYDAETNFAGPRSRGLTFGTWSVVSSDNPEIIGGAGTVSGDPTGCPDCIVDVFTGRVY